MKKRLKLICAFCIAAVAAVCMAGALFASADFGYEVIIDKTDGSFAGVNLTDSTGGALTFAGDGRTEKTDYDVMITYEIDNLEKSSTNGILIRIDRSMATADLNPRMLLETSDGILYRLYYNSNDAFINSDGTPLDTSGWASNITFSTPKQMNGTFFIPWGSVTASGTVMPDSEATVPAINSAVPNGTVFTRLHFIVQTRIASQLQVTRSTAIGAIATVRRNTEDLSASVVTSLLDVGSLSYTVDSSATADVNLGDMKNGSTVYSKYTTDGSFNVSQDENTLSAMTFTRNAAEITVECKDNSGNSVGNNLTVRAAYDKTNGNFPFDISGIIPEINGYTFDSELSDSLSGVINGNTKITLVYKINPGPKLVEKYVNENGDELSADTLAKITCEDGKYYYSCEPKKIFGYKFKAADKSLSGEITADGTVTYVYESAAIDDYTVIYDKNGEFAGVDINTETMGTVMIVGTNTGKATTDLSMTTFELGEVSTAEADGLLIQIDRSVAADIQQPRVLLETEDGILYKFNERNLRYDTFILDDGTISSLENELFHYNLEKESKGTLFIPWNVLTTTGTVMPYATVPAPAGNLKVSESTVFTKFHFCLDSRAASLQGINRPTGIGVIAAVSYKGGTVITERLLSPVSLTYSSDANETNAGVNLANNALGTKVYVKHSVTGSFVVDGSATDTEEALAAVELKRRAVQITLNFVDENGVTVKSSMSKQADYVDGKIVYDLSPETVVGYDFVSSDVPLKGETDGAITITLTYKKKVLKITIKYVDEDGNTIAEDKVIDVYYGEYTEITADEIAKYEYVSASESLNFTPVKNKEITLTYRKTGGCGASFDFIGLSAVLTVITSATFLAVKGKKKD